MDRSTKTGQTLRSDGLRGGTAQTLVPESGQAVQAAVEYVFRKAAPPLDPGKIFLNLRQVEWDQWFASEFGQLVFLVRDGPEIPGSVDKLPENRHFGGSFRLHLLMKRGLEFLEGHGLPLLKHSSHKHAAF
jgi:hypothetical protein